MTDRPTASISTVKFSGGQVFSFSPNEKVILVGPNNSGKSQTLREVTRFVEIGKADTTVVVHEVKIHKKGTAQELKAFLNENAEFDGRAFNYKNWKINADYTEAWSQPYLTSGLAPGYIKNINANERLSICRKQKSVSSNERKTHPQHVLYDDSALMEKVSDLFRQAFGKGIMFDFRGGSVLPIHVGERPDARLVDRVGDEYVAAVRENPLLDQQGDGMMSYAGILFETIVSDLDIYLLDEPEAFLHPPQMRRLGQTLASEVKGQLLVATHSSDIMRGFLDGTKGNVRVLRIRREGDHNLVSEAAPAVIKELWVRPELKYSNALEGVFHEETIICEHDGDCRLFNAMADYLAGIDTVPWKDTAYVPTGGKHSVRNIADVLRKIGVPVKAIFDIDFLNDKELVEKTVEAFGGDWNVCEPLWHRVSAAVLDGVPSKSQEEIKNDLLAIIDQWTEGSPPKSKIIEALKQNSSWNSLKKVGPAVLPNGHAQTQYKELKEYLEGIGIYLVPVGEVENFCRELGSHGPKFVNKLLSSVALDDDRLSDLRDFTAHVHKGKHAPL